MENQIVQCHYLNKNLILFAYRKKTPHHKPTYKTFILLLDTNCAKEKSIMQLSWLRNSKYAERLKAMLTKYYRTSQFIDDMFTRHATVTRWHRHRQGTFVSRLLPLWWPRCIRVIVIVVIKQSFNVVQPIAFCRVITNLFLVIICLVLTCIIFLFLWQWFEVMQDVLLWTAACKVKSVKMDWISFHQCCISTCLISSMTQHGQCLTCCLIYQWTM